MSIPYTSNEYVRQRVRIEPSSDLKQALSYSCTLSRPRPSLVHCSIDGFRFKYCELLTVAPVLITLLRSYARNYA